MDVSFDDERHDFNRGNNSNETLTAINGAAAVIFIVYRRGENTSWKILITSYRGELELESSHGLD